ncbi:methyltransferase domain-containing protein [Gordonia jinhuaensis]|uniref:SAM-dependent methyltransferase n=1 Tax=Gordonia jinhuaensis TaxID=1517702 RepID=A0A916T1C5_9ACTN|nr:methyltransferase domain-containing protein [Gordonia jinhuaensis]GGB23444.1 SAM-dependent methyltransferase [Gordonia jinhuaensis]
MPALTSSFENALDILACPLCGNRFEFTGNTLVCTSGHSFDISRKRFVTMLTGGGTRMRSDTPEMLSARSRVLASPFFFPALATVADMIAQLPLVGERLAVADIGAGTGQYLAAVIRRLASDRPTSDVRGVGLDLSKHAARMIASMDAAVSAIVADAWARLPLADSSVEVVLSVFAPRNVKEFRRVITEDGHIVMVTPTPRHLQEITTPMGMLSVDDGKAERLAAVMSEDFTPASEELVEYHRTLGVSEIEDLVAMGPSAFHLSPDQIAARAAELGHTNVTLSLVVSVFSPRPRVAADLGGDQRDERA